ncbi:hypothetical protein BYT27DRAFT_6735665 [Phlegmacium glaucopus]|nr:hypothetical protein BYT27DRAFT_6735665 [Phlegmacium glaucopus]
MAQKHKSHMNNGPTRYTGGRLALRNTHQPCVIGIDYTPFFSNMATSHTWRHRQIVFLIPLSWDFAFPCLYDISKNVNPRHLTQTHSLSPASTLRSTIRLGYIILDELLAYQFALPVGWIQTQDALFTTHRLRFHKYPHSLYCTRPMLWYSDWSMVFCV